MNTSPSTSLSRLASWLVLCVGLFLWAATVRADVSWTQRHLTNGSGNLIWGITQGNAGMVTVGSNGQILHSVDGKTWTRCNSGTSVWLVAAGYGNGKYIVVGDNGTILSSQDGETWTPVSRPGTTARLNNVLYAQNKFVVVGEAGTVLVSTDGTTWNSTDSGVTGWLHGLAFGAGHWIATGQAGAVTISTDGIVWTKQSSSTSRNLEAVAFAESVSSQYNQVTSTWSEFLAVGDAGISVLCTFYDSGSQSSFYTWTPYPGTGTNVRLGSIAIYNGLYIATGDNGTVLTTTSYYNSWTPVNLGTTKLLNASGFGLSSLFLAGEDETIYQSDPIFISRLGNISTRGVVGSGANVMIAGVIVDGTLPKRLLLRGVGPKLTSFGLSNVVPDPKIEVYDAQQKPIAANAGWGTNINPQSVRDATAEIHAFELPEGSKDSAMVITLNPGAYTCILSSPSGSNAVGLIEAYDLDELNSTSSRAINISTRGYVGSGDNVLIAGVIIQGPASKTLLIRGVGPTLGSSFSVPGALADPVIRLVQSDGSTVASNDDWGKPTTVFGHEVSVAELKNAMEATGVFPFPDGSKDSAMLVTLAPGAYTIIVSGKNNTSGVALVEAYEVKTE